MKLLRLANDDLRADKPLRTFVADGVTRLTSLSLPTQCVEKVRASSRRLLPVRENRKSKIVNPENAFTMIEIAIALAVIAFALVAIIGVLPTGMNVQKDNREDTIINQDGPFWLEAIRNGSKGLDYLTNYVDSIGVVLVNTNGVPISTNYMEYNDSANKTGSNIVGLLSIPKWFQYSYPGGDSGYVGRVEARVRALTGSATEQGTNNSDFAFAYLMSSEVVPYNFSHVAQDSTNWIAYTNSKTPSDWITRSNQWRQVLYIPTLSREVRLKFRWPLFGTNGIGPGQQLFRSIVSGNTQTTNNLHFNQPQIFGQ